MLEFEEQRLKLQSYHGELIDLKDAIGYDNLKVEIADLENATLVDGFWDDVENSQKTYSNHTSISNAIIYYECYSLRE